MKIKNLIFFVLFSFISISVFCMKKTQLIRQSFLEKKGLRGRVTYNKLLYFIKSQKEEKKKKEIISTVAANIINCSIEKVSTSSEAIADELKNIPKIGGIFNISGIRGFTNTAFRWVSPAFYSLESAKKKKNDIKEDIEKFLTEKSFGIVEMEGLDNTPSPWFCKEFESFDSDHPENKEIYAEILCVAADLAKQNKELFETVLNAAKVISFSYIRDWFYEQLAKASDIEEKIIISYFGELKEEEESEEETFSEESQGGEEKKSEEKSKKRRWSFW